MTTKGTDPFLDALVQRAAGLVGDGGRAILAIVGAPGCGKSTLTDALAAFTGAAHLPMDGFHLADVELNRLGRRHRKGASDTFDASGFVATLRRVQERSEPVVYVPGFARDLEQPIAASIAIPRETPLVIAEGLYLLHDADEWSNAAPYFTESWFLDLDDTPRRERLVARHVQFGKSLAAATAWVNEVDEPNARLVARSRARADLVVEMTGWRHDETL